MNYFEIQKNGKIFIRTDSGTIIREVGNGEPAEFADFNANEEMFVITYMSGLCEIRNRKNELVKTIASEGVRRAYFKNDSLLVYYMDGTDAIVNLSL